MAEKDNRETQDFYEAMPATMDNYSLVIDDDEQVDRSSWTFLLWLVVPIALAGLAVWFMSIGSKPLNIEGNQEWQPTPIGDTNTSTADTESLPTTQAP